MLTNKEETFVKEYLVDLNATRAAIRAGYSACTSVKSQFRLLRRPEVAEAIRRGMEARAERLELTGEEVLRSILAIRDRAVDEGRFSQALKANELLGRHLKLFTDRVEHSGPGGGPVEISDLELSNRLLCLIAALEERSGGD